MNFKEPYSMPSDNWISYNRASIDPENNQI